MEAKVPDPELLANVRDLRSVRPVLFSVAGALEHRSSVTAFRAPRDATTATVTATTWLPPDDAGPPTRARSCRAGVRLSAADEEPRSPPQIRRSPNMRPQVLVRPQAR